MALKFTFSEPLKESCGTSGLREKFEEFQFVVFSDFNFAYKSLKTNDKHYK